MASRPATDDPGRRPRLTRRALAMGAAGLVLLGLGRTFGVGQLFPLGLACLLLVGLSWALVAVAPVEVEAVRRVVPSRVPAGSPCRVDLHVRNRGRRRSAVLLARDPFDGGRRWARFRVAPLRGGEGATAAYRVPTDRRGVFELGPLRLTRSDPLGLASREREVAGVATLTVYPRVDRIAPLPHTRGQDPRGGSQARPSIGASGEDFHALRQYVVGDDLRRVHWASSARVDELLIRQDELPWQGRATVVVDLRAPLHTEATFEGAMSAAASIASACADASVEVRLVGTDGTDTGFGVGRAHVEAILEQLAAWEPDVDPDHGLTTTLAGVALARDSALCLVTTGRAGRAALDAAARVRRSGGRGPTVVVFDPSAELAAGAPGVALVRAPSQAGFPKAWEGVHGPARRVPTRTSR